MNKWIKNIIRINWPNTYSDRNRSAQSEKLRSQSETQ